MEKIHATEAEQHGALRNELKNLMELNDRITTETTNLTRALKGDSKVQGDFGEMILDTILSSSNLIKGSTTRRRRRAGTSRGLTCAPTWC